jgi:SAM-dependent methyltransferase
MWSFTKHRSGESELMDDPSIQGPVLESTLIELESINRLLGAYPPTLDGLARLLPPGQKNLSVLDVGAGGGDVARAMIDWGRARGVEVQVTCIDLTDTTINFARARSTGYPELKLVQQDLFLLPDQASYDVVHAGQVLHHFPGELAAKALNKMATLSRLGVLIHDLHRHALAWGGIKVLTRLLAKSPLIRNDAPLSVLRGFVREDWDQLAQDAGLSPPAVRWQLPFRWQVIFSPRSRSG